MLPDMLWLSSILWIGTLAMLPDVSKRFCAAERNSEMCIAKHDQNENKINNKHYVVQGYVYLGQYYIPKGNNWVNIYNEESWQVEHMQNIDISSSNEILPSARRHNNLCVLAA